MLYGLMITLYIFVCVMLILIILMQRGKGSSGIGVFGGNTQMLFGGSGGQDILQKITWFLGTLFLTLSLTISLSRSYDKKNFRYVKNSTMNNNVDTTTQSQSTAEKAL